MTSDPNDSKPPGSHHDTGPEQIRLEDLTPEQLQAFAEVRNLRRDSENRFTEVLQATDARMKAAFSTQSEQRHRYMVLAGGGLALWAPLVGRSDLQLWTGLFVYGAVAFGLHIVVGVLIDASQEARWAKTVKATYEDVEAQQNLRFAQDVRVAMARRGDFNPDWANAESEAARRRGEAACALTAAGARRRVLTNVLVGLFYATFLAGAGLLLASALPAAARANGSAADQKGRGSGRVGATDSNPRSTEPRTPDEPAKSPKKVRIEPSPSAIRTPSNVDPASKKR